MRFSSIPEEKDKTINFPPIAVQFKYQLLTVWVATGNSGPEKADLKSLLKRSRYSSIWCLQCFVLVFIHKKSLVFFCCCCVLFFFLIHSPCQQNVLSLSIKTQIALSFSPTEPTNFSKNTWYSKDSKLALKGWEKKGKLIIRWKTTYRE